MHLESGKEISTENCVIISTLPITKNATLFNIDTDLYFRSILLVNFIIKGEDPFPKNYDWLYFDSGDFPFHRVGMQTRFSRKNIKKDHQIMCCEIVYDKKLSDDKVSELVNNSIASLKRINLLDETKIIDTCIKDVGPVYPGYYFGHEKEVSKGITM